MVSAGAWEGTGFIPLVGGGWNLDRDDSKVTKGKPRECGTWDGCRAASASDSGKGAIAAISPPPSRGSEALQPHWTWLIINLSQQEESAALR